MKSLVIFALAWLAIVIILGRLNMSVQDEFENFEAGMEGNETARDLFVAGWNARNKQAEPVACQYCNGAGDVHRLDGEWRGQCSECKQAVAQGDYSWATGEPPKWFEEWFIAKLDSGQRVVLKRLPEEFTYDYTTADETYYAKHRIAKWMQFPDSQFVDLNEAPAVAQGAVLRRVALDLLKGSEANFTKQFGVCANADWVYRDLEELFSCWGSEAPAVAVNEQMREALFHAFNMGQTYKVLADSLETGDYKKADLLFERYKKFAEDAVQSLNHTPDTSKMVRLTDEDIEALRHKTFSTNNPFCPCDAKTMRKAAHAIMDAMERVNGGKA